MDDSLTHTFFMFSYTYIYSYILSIASSKQREKCVQMMQSEQEPERQGYTRSVVKPVVTMWFRDMDSYP